MTARALWTVDAMAEAMSAERQGAVAPSVSGISIDSRTIVAGDAFFALSDRRDGHEFVAAALAAGAGLAVVAADRRAQFPADAPLLVVPDVLAGLRDLAAAARARTQAKVIGVTGSVGKTGTKEALRLALSKDGETHASVASYNNHWGVPLSLARCPQSARYAVLEMGMNHAGELAPLSRLARPHIALITTIAPVHLEFFGSLTKIADAKAEIFLGLEADGAAVLNRDIKQFAHLKRRAKEAGVARVVSFGEHAKADARLIKYALHPHCSTVVAQILGTELTYKIGAPGRHLVGIRLRCWRLRCWPEPISRSPRWHLPSLSRLPGAGRPSRLISRVELHSSSTRATTRIPHPSMPHWPCSARLRSDRADGASLCSATCWNSDRKVRRFIGRSPSRSPPIPSILCSAAGR